LPFSGIRRAHDPDSESPTCSPAQTLRTGSTRQPGGWHPVRPGRTRTGPSAAHGRQGSAFRVSCQADRQVRPAVPV